MDNDMYACSNHTDTLWCTGRCSTCLYGYLIEEEQPEGE